MNIFILLLMLVCAAPKLNYRYSVPKGWAQHQDVSDGLLLIRGKSANEGVNSSITVDEMTPTEAEEYIQGYYHPPAILEKRKDELPSPLAPVKLKAGDARRFTLRSERPDTLHDEKGTKFIPVTEEHVVLVKDKRAFIFTLITPSSAYKKHRPAFQKVLDSFKP